MPRATLYRITGESAVTSAEARDAPLRLVVAASPEAQAQALAVVRVCCPAPHRVDAFGPVPLGDVDAVLLWWSADAAPVTAELRKQAQTAHVPLVALCGGGAEDQAAALEAGADASCGLAVQPRLLRALVAAHRRVAVERSPAAAPTIEPAEEEDARSAGPIRLDRRAHTCAIAGQRLDLTLKEFDLLAYFLDHAGACCSRDELLEQVWGLDFDPGSNSVDVFVYTLRRKLKARGFVGVIQTVRGLGYRLVPPTLSA